MAVVGGDDGQGKEGVIDGITPQYSPGYGVQHQVQQDGREKHQARRDPAEVAQDRQADHGDPEPDQRDMGPIAVMMDRALIHQMKPQHVQIGQHGPDQGGGHKVTRPVPCHPCKDKTRWEMGGQHQALTPSRWPTPWRQQRVNS